MNELIQASEGLKELMDDPSIPRNIREKLQTAVDALGAQSEDSLKIDKAMQELDDVADDVNLQSYTRTQIWNIVSLLEKC